MNRDRWLITLLFVSWTINVALVVMFFVGKYDKDREPPPFPLPPSGAFAPPHGGMSEMGGDLRAEMAPLAGERRRLMNELTSMLTADSLDTSRIRQVDDSLDMMRRELQGKWLQHLTMLHDSMTPEQRRQFGEWMMKRNEDGRPMRGGRHGFPWFGSH